MVTRIVSLNIRQGGGKRIAALADWIAAKMPSAVILPEWRNNNSGQYIRQRFTEGGFATSTPTRSSHSNSILLAAVGLADSLEVTPPGSAAGDLMLVEIAGIKLLGCYFPQRDAKAPFFRQCIRVARTHEHAPFLMIGDLNTGRNDLDIEGAGARFHCTDLFDALSSEAGLIDLWRAQHGERREWTWRSPVNGFRIDHAHANATFMSRFPAFRCEIDHTPRLSGLTDHSAIILETDGPWRPEKEKSLHCSLRGWKHRTRGARSGIAAADQREEGGDRGPEPQAKRRTECHPTKLSFAEQIVFATFPVVQVWRR
jgi:exonuclease III